MKNLAGISVRPGVVPTLVTLFMLALLVMLGVWQLHRAEQKRQLQRQFAEGAATLVELTGDLPTLPRYQRVRTRGTFDNEHQFLLENMMYNGVPGYYVLSILQLTGGKGRLVVNRGWLPASADRKVPSGLSLPVGERLLTGRLDLLPRPGLKLESQTPGASAPWPRLVVFPDMAELAEQVSSDLYPMVLLLDASAEDGFKRDWSPVNFGPERHIAYAVQWFALAATLLVIFLIVNVKRGGSQ